jgi:capsular exopolysaccharide synthesis family protein
MSRIDEALRRASFGGGVSAPAPTEPLAGGPARRTQLSDYPEEARVGGNGRPPESSVPRRAIAAPRVGSGARLVSAGGAHDARIVGQGAGSIALEEYRRLAASLHELQVAHGTKTLMVASALPREGKTLTVTNLALTLSESYGRRVLLIDADLRRPSIHGLLRLPNARGLSEGLQDDARDLSLLQVSQTLSVLPAGHPGPQPLAGLTSHRMRSVLEEASSAFDWVLLDSPPVGIMPDANLLAGLTDGVILVIAAGVTPYTAVERAVDAIGRDHVIGSVLNRAEERNLPASSYYHEYYGRTEASAG